MAGNTIITSNTTERALTNNLSSSLQVMSNVAANAVATGLEFEDVESISSAVSAFTKEDLFSYISVNDRNGNQMFKFRREGLEAIAETDLQPLVERNGEIFNQTRVKSGGTVIGTIWVGVLLDERDKALASAETANIIASLVIVAIFIFVTIVFANMITDPLKKIARIAANLARGDLSQQVSIQRGDEIGELASAFREMIESEREKANIANEIAQGNLDITFEARSEQDVLGQAMVTMKESITAMKRDLQTTNDAQKAGTLDVRCQPERFRGAYAELLQGVNDSLDAVIGPLSETADILRSYATGNLEKSMRTLPGQQVVLSESINTIRRNLQALIDEGVMLADAAEKGRLQSRGDATKFSGGYRQIIDGMNNTITNIVRPINEGVELLTKIAGGDLTATIASNYAGDHAKIKNAMNRTIDALNDILGQVSLAVNQVNSGAQQVTDSSNALSRGAAEQASSLEQITASMNEIGSQTKKNAENSAKANQLAGSARDIAEEGNRQMKKMLIAMNDINKASGDISQIIKAIDEIAFQTNLLALNAAVEAARAGVHGKGFAVVAEEVRNLAQRSANAAKETTELIETSVHKVGNGTRIANATAESLNEIVSGVTTVTDLIAEIASASNQQSQQIDQVNSGLGRIDQVTHANTASAEETASAAEELSNQADQLRRTVGTFSLRGMGSAFATGRRQPTVVTLDKKGVFISESTGETDGSDTHTGMWGE
jgi:methyl-accepting chemotaxis protein